jgi:hypothetical protein
VQWTMTCRSFIGRPLAAVAGDIVRMTLLSAGQVLQIQVDRALDGGPGGPPAGGHSRISSVERSAGSAFGNARAIARRVVGCVPDWRSHRRSASTAVSVPSM